MAIVKMNEFTLLTFETYKGDLLKELQKFEDVHFKNLLEDDVAKLDFLSNYASGEDISRNESELSKINFAITRIKPYLTKPKGLKGMTAPLETLSFTQFDSYTETYDYTKVYNLVKDADLKIKTVKSEKSKLKAENINLKSWTKLDVSVKQLEQLKTVKSLTGTINKLIAESFRENVESRFDKVYIEFFGNIKEDVAALVIIPLEEYEEVSSHLKTLGFSNIALNFSGVPSEMIAANNQRIDELQVLEEEALGSAKELAGEYSKLQIANDYFKTALERAKASEKFLKTKSLIFIEGWVPTEKSDEFKTIVAGICREDFYLEERDVEKESEEVPIKLKNNKFVSAFEDITAMYSMPKYCELDPTPLLAPFYFIFFGIMVGDAGYGLVLLLGTLYALKNFTLDKGTRRFVQFFHYLGYSTILAGIMFGSCFGFTFFAPIKVIRDGIVSYKPIFDSGTDIVIMLVLSMVIGVFQIVFGLLVKGYMLLRDGKVPDAIYDSLFWIVAVLSGIGLIVGSTGMLPEGAMAISKWSFVISILGLIATQGRENKTIVGKVAGGLFGVYGISSYVGDIVSYTRIVALSLSGAYIAMSFNLMANLIPGPMKYIFGTIIVLLGAALNFGLSALGAYVHTCRLQYVEYFGKFYEGGGKPFVPFELKNTHINIKK